MKPEKNFFKVDRFIQAAAVFYTKDDTLMIPHFVSRDKNSSLKSSLRAVDEGLMSPLVYDIKVIFLS